MVDCDPVPDPLDPPSDEPADQHPKSTERGASGTEWQPETPDMWATESGDDAASGDSADQGAGSGVEGDEAPAGPWRPDSVEGWEQAEQATREAREQRLSSGGPRSSSGPGRPVLPPFTES